MKDIIIIGRPRAGKSTLADKLVNTYGYQIIRLDELRNTFRDIFPELSIAPHTAINNEKWYKFFMEYYENLKKFSRYKYKFIIEGCEMHISKCAELFGKDDDKLIYVLSQIDIKPNDMANNILKYDTKDDWTKIYKYDELLEYCKNSIEKAKKIKRDCEQYGLRFYDTSKNREKVLQEIVEEIKNEK